MSKFEAWSILIGVGALFVFSLIFTIFAFNALFPSLAIAITVKNIIATGWMISVFYSPFYFYKHKT